MIILRVGSCCPFTDRLLFHVQTSTTFVIVWRARFLESAIFTQTHKPSHQSRAFWLTPNLLCQKAEVIYIYTRLSITHKPHEGCRVQIALPLPRKRPQGEDYVDGEVLPKLTRKKNEENKEGEKRYMNTVRSAHLSEAQSVRWCLSYSLIRSIGVIYGK